MKRDKIGLWGVALSGGEVIRVGAVDRRVKAVLSQVPMVNGWENFHRLTPPHLLAGFNAVFEEGMWCLTC